MKERIQVALAVSALTLIAACTTDKGATPADTAIGQSTTVAPASASAPVLSAPSDSVPTAVPVNPVAANPKTSTQPKASAPKIIAPKSATEPMLRDSAFKPRATVDEKGNIQPIKRDTLR